MCSNLFHNSTHCFLPPPRLCVNFIHGSAKQCSTDFIDCLKTTSASPVLPRKLVSATISNFCSPSARGTLIFLSYHVSGRMMISREPKVPEARQHGATWNEKKRTSPCLWHFESSLIFYPPLTWWAKDMVVPPALGVLRQSVQSVTSA
jgi:hypothetical protein